MKKITVSIFLVLMLALSWFYSLRESLKERNIYYDYLKTAQESMDRKLYEQAIENYKQFLNYKNDSEVYQNILKAYELLYEEENSSYIRGCYISDMELAASAYPKCAEYWLKQIELYQENSDDSKAYAVAKAAMSHNVKEERLEQIYEELLYKVKTSYKIYTDYKTCLNGYITVFDGNQWKVIDNKGLDASSNYQLVGLINDEGKGIYVNDIDVRLLDKNEVPRARFDIEIEDAGYYSEISDCVAVKIGGKWRYLKSDGTFISGEYDQAGSFYNHQAAVKEDDKWYLINEDGQAVSSQRYEDIKLDLYGCHLQGNIILAKENGKYHIYNSDFNQIADFECDDIDICIDNNLIAFKQGNLWGYVDTKGRVVLEPQYVKARSFSNGMAAICNADGMWGFINRDYKVVIDYLYQDAYYYTSDETCVVSTQKGSYQIQSYVFE